MRLSIVIAVALAACSPGTEPRSPAAEPAIAPAVQLPPPPPPAISAPHGSAITRVAITEQGDAAVTADSDQRLRIWPTLDGSHEPVVLAAAEPKQLAITRDGVTLLVAILDEVGNLELVRVDREGRILGRAHAAGEQTYLELAPVASGMLALRADRAVERFDAAGTSRGVLWPDAGSRVVSIATRTGAAIALLDTGDAPSRLHWIAVTDQLMWGTTVQLPVTIDRVALSPNHHRIAGIARGGTNAAIVELAPAVAVIGNTPVSDDRRRAFGFIADDRAAFGMPSALAWWVAPSPATHPIDPTDPWNAVVTETPGALGPTSISDTEVAFGDGIAVAGYATSLMLVTPVRTTYLGYRELASGALASHGGAVTHSVGGRLMWIDASLASGLATGKAEAQIAIAQALDAHRVLATRTDRSRPAVLEETDSTPTPNVVLVRDVATGAELEIGKFTPYASYGYDPASRVVTISAETRAERYQLDAAFATATRLRPLAIRDGSTVVPCGRGDVVATATSGDDEGKIAFATFVDARPSGSPLRPRTVAVDGTAIGTDPGCRLVVSRWHGTQLELWRYDGATPTPTRVASIPMPPGNPGVAGTFSSDGSAVGLITGNEVLVVDTATGTVRWRISLWGPHSIVFTGDDRQVIVASQGLLAFDATTGRRTATTCGWHFALGTDASDANPFGIPTVCEEGEVAP